MIQHERNIDLRKLKQFKDILYEGQVIQCSKPYSETDSRVGLKPCTARIIKKSPHTVTLEDLDSRCKTRKIFTRTYFELMGGYANG